MPKVSNKYRLLRNKLREYDLDQEYLGELLGRSRSHISLCLSGKSEWLMSEVYTIAKICQIPKEEILRYFPPGGVDLEVDVEPDPTSKFAAELAGLLQSYIKEAAKI